MTGLLQACGPVNASFQNRVQEISVVAVEATPNGTRWYRLADWVMGIRIGMQLSQGASNQ
jgi:hypothetical protein